MTKVPASKGGVTVFPLLLPLQQKISNSHSHPLATLLGISKIEWKYAGMLQILIERLWTLILMDFIKTITC